MRRVLTLPYPPSINHYWRKVGPGVLVSKEGRLYRERVRNLLADSGAAPMRGRLRLNVVVYMPDRRRRDLDNILKCLADSLVHAGAMLDDSQIDDWRIVRGPVAPPGEVVVELETIR